MKHRLTRDSLHGVWHGLLTPWAGDGTLDVPRMIEEVRAFAGTGIHGVYTGGTTGEFYAQDYATYEQLTHLVVEHAHAVDLPVQIGVTTLSTHATCWRINQAVAAGADGVQVALPSWLALSDEEVLDFMDDCAAAADPLPLTLYVTMRSKRRVSAELLAQLAARIPALIGTKDTTATPDEVRRMATMTDVAIFGGEDFFVRLPLGGRGGYCALTGLNPRFMVQLYEACRDGHHETAARLNDQLQRFREQIVIPMVEADQLMDSAIDRVFRAAGGGRVGLRCLKPYRSATPQHVERVLAFCRSHAPDLLPTRVAAKVV